VLGPITAPEPEPLVLTSPKQGLAHIRAATRELPPIIHVGGPAAAPPAPAPAYEPAPAYAPAPVPAARARAMSMPDMPPFFGIEAPSSPPPAPSAEIPPGPSTAPQPRPMSEAPFKTGTMMLDIDDQPGGRHAPVHAPSAAAPSVSSPELPAMLRGHTGSANAYAPRESQPSGARRNVVPPGAFAVGQLTDGLQASVPAHTPANPPRSTGSDPRRPALRPMTMPPIDFGESGLPPPNFSAPQRPQFSEPNFAASAPGMTEESSALVSFKRPVEFRGSGGEDTGQVSTGAAWRDPSRTVFATKARNLQATKRTTERTSAVGIAIAAALLGFSMVLGILLVRRILH
jgi:hypothetical protein